MVPEAAGQLPVRVGAVNERHRKGGRRQSCRVQHRAPGQGWSSHVFPPDYWMFACPFLGLSAFFRAWHLVYRGLTRAARDAEPGKMDRLLGLKMNYNPMNLFICSVITGT